MEIDLITGKDNTASRLKNVERQEWRLWSTAVLVTLMLTMGLVSFLLPHPHSSDKTLEGIQIIGVVRGLICLVLLFDVYVIYQHLQIFRIRRQLVEHEELFRLISENAADMIALVDADGKRIYNSPSYYKVLGYTHKELKETSAFEQIHADDRERLQEAIEATRNTGAGQRMEYRMRHKDGSWRMLESTANAVLDSAGKVSNLVIVNRDITDRKRLEEQYRQSQKMEAVGRLSGGIAHDFNNLLGVMIGFAEILEIGLASSPELLDSVEEILKAGKRAGALTRQLLAFSRQQVLEPRILDLNNTIAEIEKMLRRIIGEDIVLTTRLDGELGRIRADEGQVEQVILNLAVNARDAMPEGGKLEVETANIEIDEEFVRQHSYPVKTGEYVLLKVTDSGIGMDAELQAHIFEPFFTTKEKGKGTGLGLATAYGIVKQSGGYIDVCSERGHGTTFKVYLPVAQGELESHSLQPGKSSMMQERKTLLVVEDEQSLLKSTCRMLSDFGYQVLGASNGGDALRLSQKHAGEIDLVLADVVMPGMSGPELVAQLNIHETSMKVVYMSGYTGQQMGRSASFDEKSSFLMKPFTRQDLERKINEALQPKNIAAAVG